MRGPLAIAVMMVPCGMAFSQDATCMQNGEVSRLIVDLQTASLLCPKWHAMARVDFVHMLIIRGLMSTDDLAKSDLPGKVIVKEPCATVLNVFESASFTEASRSGLEAFCTRMSFHLTSPNIRYDLEELGVIEKR